MDETQLKILSAELIRDEGEVLHAYQDSAGCWTIGVGTLIDARRGGGITREESRYLLSNRIAAKQAELDSAIPWWRSLLPRPPAGPAQYGLQPRRRQAPVFSENAGGDPDRQVR